MDQSDKVQERYSDDDGHWIYLRRGFCIDEQGCHTIREDSERLANKKLCMVETCTCADCVVI